MESFTFIDDNKRNTPLVVVDKFNQSSDIGVHRPIQTKELDFWGGKFIDLDWS
jgi:hypothetical protein